MDNSKPNQEFNPGDTVQLKLGGPIMTIANSSYDGKRSFYCLWFTKDEDKVRDGYFPPDSLQLYVNPRKKGTVKGNF